MRYSQFTSQDVRPSGPNPWKVVYGITNQRKDARIELARAGREGEVRNPGPSVWSTQDSERLRLLRLSLLRFLDSNFPGKSLLT